MTAEPVAGSPEEVIAALRGHLTVAVGFMSHFDGCCEPPVEDDQPCRCGRNQALTQIQTIVGKEQP